MIKNSQKLKKSNINVLIQTNNLKTQSKKTIKKRKANQLNKFNHLKKHVLLSNKWLKSNKNKSQRISIRFCSMQDLFHLIIIKMVKKYKISFKNKLSSHMLIQEYLMHLNYGISSLKDKFRKMKIKLLRSISNYS